MESESDEEAARQQERRASHAQAGTQDADTKEEPAAGMCLPLCFIVGSMLLPVTGEQVSCLKLLLWRELTLNYLFKCMRI